MTAETQIKTHEHLRWRNYGIHWLLMGHHEQTRIDIEDPNNFIVPRENNKIQMPNPLLTSRLLVPLLTTARAYSLEPTTIFNRDKKITVRGSTFRHAVAALNHGWPPNRYSVNSVLRRHVFVDSTEEFEAMRTERPEAFAAYLELASGPDMDLIVDVPERFYSEGLPEMVRSLSHPRVISTLLEKDHYDEDLTRYVEANKNCATRHRQPLDSVVDTSLLDPDVWKYVARISDIPVHLIPWDNPEEARIPYPLLITLREFRREGGVHLGKVTFAADLREDPSQPIRETDIYPVINVDFRQKPSPELAKNDNRILTSYDAVTGPLHGSINGFIGISPEAQAVINQPVKLIDIWKDRPFGNALEAATRAIWQAIDRSLLDNGLGSFMPNETLSKMKEYFGKVDRSEWDSIKPFAQRMIRMNLLTSMLVDPYATMIYLGESGLWDIIRNRPQNTNLPEWQAITRKMPQAFLHASSRDMILHREWTKGKKRYSDMTGLDVIDTICYPDADSKKRLTRMFDLATI